MKFEEKWKRIVEGESIKEGYRDSKYYAYTTDGRKVTFRAVKLDDRGQPLFYGRIEGEDGETVFRASELKL